MSETVTSDLPVIDKRLFGIALAAYPRILKMRERVLSLQFATPEDAKRLHALKGRRVLFLPNHPTASDPPVVFGLSRLLDEQFRFAAMEELFEGTIGSIVSRLGAFPIRRGTADRLALRRAQASLRIPAGKLVLFPEGEAHGQNDNLLPLNPGFAQIAFWTMEKLKEDEGDNAELLLQPVAIKYRYTDAADARDQMNRGLHHLEEFLGMDNADEHESLYRRTHDAAMVVLTGIEDEYDLKHKDDVGIEERVAAVYTAIENRVVAMLRVAPPKEEHIAHRMRALFNAAYSYRERMEKGETKYSHLLQKRREAIADACLSDLRRVENFMGVHGQRLNPDATLEQLNEMVVRLEVEVFGEKHTRPTREAYLALGEPLSGKKWMDAYNADKRKAVADVTAEITSELRGLLDRMRDIATPIVNPQNGT